MLSAESSKMKFMVVCGYALLRESFRNLLSQTKVRQELTVLEAPNTQSALHYTAQSEAPLDLIIFYLDINDVGWRQLTELAEKSNVPIMVVADFREEKEIRKAIGLGANGCVSTEFNWKTVTSVMFRILAGDIVSPSLKYTVRETEPDPLAAVQVADPDASRSSPTVNNGVQVDGVDVRLTPRQLDVLNLIREGKSNKEIARALTLAEGTVKIHCVAIFRELGVTNRTQAAIVAETLFS